jgi:Transposase DDE domain group 1
MLAIGCGYPDGNDFDRLRFDPAFRLACGRLPETGADLCSQPTISRWENAPSLREIIRLTYILVYGLVLGWFRWVAGSTILTILLHSLITFQGNE